MKEFETGDLVYHNKSDARQRGLVDFGVVIKKEHTPGRSYPWYEVHWIITNQRGRHPSYNLSKLEDYFNAI